MLLESFLPDNLRIQRHAVRTKRLRVNVVTKPAVKRSPFVPLLEVRSRCSNHLPRVGQRNVWFAEVQCVIAEHKQRLAPTRVCRVALQEQRRLLRGVVGDLREVHEQFHLLRPSEVFAREHLLCDFHAARYVASNGKLDVLVVKQPGRHVGVWNAFEDAEIAVVAAALVVMREVLNDYALVLDGLRRLNREGEMFMHRALPLARAAQNHALAWHRQPFAMNVVWKDEAGISAPLGVLADEIRPAQEHVVGIAPKAVVAGR